MKRGILVQTQNLSQKGVEVSANRQIRLHGPSEQTNIILKINRDYLPKEHQDINACNGHVLWFL